MSLLDRKDLSRLSRSSSHLLRLLRPYIFRKVSLYETWGGKLMKSMKITSRLLGSGEQLVDCVIKFSITFGHEIRRLDGIAEAIMAMDSLNELRADAFLFLDRGQQRTVIEHLWGRKKPIENLVLRLFKDEDFKLDHLVKFIWWLSGPCKYFPSVPCLTLSPGFPSFIY